MTLGTPSFYRINRPESTVPSFTAASWNPHLPKMSSYNGWRYATYAEERDGTDEDYANREATVYASKIADPGWHNTGRIIREYANVPGLVCDTQGRLHLTFNCVGVCASGGANDDSALERWYDLIFSTLQRNGSINLRDDLYQNWNENVSDNLGYMGLSTDPRGDRGNTYGAVAFMDTPGDPSFRSQWSYSLGPGVPDYLQFPRHSSGAYALYPQMAFPETGGRYGWTASFDGAATTSWMYGGFDLLQLSNDTATSVFSQTVSSPTDSGNDISLTGLRFAYPYDLAHSVEGALYATYGKETGACKAFLAKESGPFTGVFTHIDIGCHDFYTQVQVSTNGNVYLVDASSRSQQSTAEGSKQSKIIVWESTNGGTSFSSTDVTIPRDDSVNGFPSATVDTYGAQLTKPWTDPNGYDPDVLHGTVCNVLNVANDSQSNAMIEFSIPVS